MTKTPAKAGDKPVRPATKSTTINPVAVLDDPYEHREWWWLDDPDHPKHGYFHVKRRRRT